MDNHSSNNNAIAALVLGITALLCVFFRLGGHVLGIVLGILGVVISTNVLKEGTNSMASAGKVLSIIAIVLCVLGIILRVLIGAAVLAAGFDFLRWLIR